MSDRLAEALKHLTPQQLELLTEFAELLMNPDRSTEPRLDWVCALKDLPDKDGLELQARSKQMWRDLVDKGQSPQ